MFFFLFPAELQVAASKSQWEARKQVAMEKPKKENADKFDNPKMHNVINSKLLVKSWLNSRASRARPKRRRKTPFT